MLKTQYPTDYLKKEGVNSKVAEQIEEEQYTQQDHRSFQPKHRVRRQYNPNDTNIAKLFLAIREHKIGNPQLDKINEIKGLLTQIQNINDIDFNDNGNTPLHVAVSKGHRDIVELLLKKHSIDVNIKNNIGKTPLDIAKESNKQDITQVLETQKVSVGQEPLVGHPQSGSSSQVGKLNPRQQSTADTEVNGRLEKFVEYFVKEFEAKLHTYHMILEGEVKKAGKFSDTFSGKIGQGVGGAVGGLVGLFLGSRTIGARVGATVGEKGGEKLGSGLGSDQHTKKVTNLLDLIDRSQKDTANFRQILVEAGFDIFQSFEMQFMRVTTNKGTKDAIHQLAKDATNRAINYVKKKKDISINEGIILGKSKKEAVHSISPGFKIQYKYQSSKKVWNTASLYEEVGVVIAGSTFSSYFSSYYKKKEGKSSTTTYGYRRLLAQESWDKLKEKYDSDNIAESKSGQFTDYQYILNLADSKEKSQNMLDHLNRKDENLIEERIMEVLGEVKNDILEEIDVLKEQSHENHVEDYKMLINIESSLKNLKIDEYLEEFKKDLEEAKQERQEIAHSIEEGREENRESFKQVNQKLDKVHNAFVIGQESNQVRRAVWFDVKELVTLFIERKDQLEKIKNNIQQKTVVIIGESGVGKSELAIKHARSQYNQQDSVIWINAKTREAAKESFSTLAKDKLKISLKDVDGGEKTIKSIVQEIYEYFADKESLFIFDNAEKYITVKEFLPLWLPPGANKPLVLITSINLQKLELENPTLPVEIVKLDNFNELEATEFIKQSLIIEDDLQNEDITRLTEKLDRLPIRLQEAVAYIKQEADKQGEFKVHDCLRDYERVERDSANSAMLQQVDDKITFATLKAALEKIESDQEYGQKALEIAHMMAYFASGNVQEEIFLELVNNDRTSLDATISLLTQYLIVKQGSISMHELVQQVMKSKLQGSAEEEKTLERALNLLKEHMEGLDSVERYVPHIISIWNHASKYDKLIEDFIVNAVNSEPAYTTYFHLIVENSSDEVVTAILDKIGSDKLEQVITARRKDQKTLLHCAALGGNEQIVRLLVDKGATVNVIDKLKNTPLHLAAKNGYLEVVNFLLDRENNVNAETQYKFIPLHLAAKNGHLKVVEALLKKGADVTAATNRGFTALHFAADNKEEEIVDVLLDLDEVKANIDSKTRHEYTSLHLAAKSGHLGIVNKLLAKGASIGAKTRYKFTPLHLAAKYGHKDVVLTLIENGVGVDVNAKDQNGFTPLHLAAQSGHIESVNALLGKSALINVQTTKGNTPLHLAVEKGHLKVVEALVARNADIDIQNEKGKTPLDLAKDSGIINIFNKHYRSLLSKGMFIKINVPADGSCLFWAATLAYLTPVKHDDNAFQERFERLFGSINPTELEQVQDLIKAYDPSSNSVAICNDETLKRLVTEKFRSRVVDEISSHQSQFDESITINDFLHSKNEDYVIDGTFQEKFRNEFGTEVIQYNIDINKFKPGTLNEAMVEEIDSELDKILDKNKVKKFKFETYVECMRNSRAWGGNHEIQAMSQILHSNILVFSDGTKHFISYDNSNDQVQLFNNGESHYNFGLVRAQTLIEAIRNNKQQEAKTYLDLGIDNINYKDSDSWTPLHFAAQYGDTEITQLLLAQGVRTDVKNRLNHTPLDVANLFERNNVVDILRGQSHVESTGQHASVKQESLVSNSRLGGSSQVGSENRERVLDQIEQNQQTTFNRRQGTSGISGQLYEIELSMLFLLQGVTKREDKKIDNFHLAANMQKAGDFDDVVFKYQYKDQGEVEKSKIIFLQAKHKDNLERKITIGGLLSGSEGDFSLSKYFRSYRKAKQQFSEEKVDPVFGSKFEDSEFIIYTNALSTFSSADNSIKEENIDQNDFLNIPDSQSKYYQLEFDSDKKEDIVNVLENSSECRKLARELVTSISSGKGIDMQKDIFKSYHVALVGKVIEKTQPKAKEGKLNDNFLNDEAHSEDEEFRKAFFEEAEKVFNKEGDELKQELQSKTIKFSDKFGVSESNFNSQLPSDLVSESEISEFLGKLKLFVDQPSEKKLGEIIKGKVKEIYKVGQQDIDSVFSDVEYRVKRWWKEGNYYLTENNKFFQESARVSILFDVKKQVDLFTGRRRELDDLHSKIQRSSEKVTVISQMTFVSGLGGIGKTELARQYIDEHSQDYDNNIIWINAENEATLIESFRRLAQDKLRISTKDIDGKGKYIKSIVEEVYRFFAKRESLFVFDNTEKSGSFNQFLPRSALSPDDNMPYILVTSRNLEWGRGVEVVELKELKPEDAVNFVKKGLNIPKDNKLHDQDIEKLVKKLQYFPLAIRQAIAYIADQRVTGEFEIQDYIDKYDKGYEETKRLLDSKEFQQDMDNDYAKTTFTTWQITVKKIGSNKECGELALKILDTIAYFAPENITRELFLSLAGNDEKQLKEAVRLLIKYSMINGEQKQSVLSIHRLVQEVTRLELKGQGKEEKTLKKALELVEKNMGKEKIDHAISAWNHASEYKELVKKFSSLPYEIINKLDDAGKYEVAYMFGERALQSLESAPESNRLHILGMKDSIAKVLREQGKYEEALKAYQKLLYEIQEFYPDNRLAILAAKNNMAQVLDNQGKHEEALKTYQEVLRGFVQLRQNELDILRVKNNMARVLKNLKRYDEALHIFHKVLEGFKEVLGLENTETLSTKSDIARVLSDQKEYNKALEIYEEVLGKFKRILGDDHHDTLTLMNNIAVVLQGQKKYKEALKAYQEVFDKSEQKFGPDNPFTLSTKNNIAKILDNQDKYDEALKIYKEVFDKRKEVLGTNHPDTLSTWFNIASILQKQGKNLNDYPDIFSTGSDTGDNKVKYSSETLKKYQDDLDKVQQTLNPDNSIILAAKNNMAKVLMAQGEYGKALKFLQEVFDIQKDSFGSDHPDTLTTRNNMGVILSDKQHKYTKALKIFHEVFDIRENKLGPNHPDTLITKKNISLTREKQEVLMHLLMSANVEAIDGRGWAQLHNAVQDDNIDLINGLLLRGDVDVNAKTNDRNEVTPLHIAAAHGYLDIVGALLKKHANPNIVDSTGKTPLALARERSAQDPENENLETITALLLSVTDESQSQHQEEQISGSVSLEECLPGPSSRGDVSRRKREAKVGECELSWEDVDSFNEEKEESRDLSKVRINSDEFIDYIKSESMPETKLAQLVQLADRVQVTGRFQGLVNELTSNQKVMNHLNRVGMVSGVAMHGMMAKATLAAFLNGDGEGVAINLGFIAGGQGFARVAQAASVKGAGLVLDGKLFLGRSLKAASPFLARGTSAFIAYDLVNQIKAFKNGTEDALVGIIGDSIYLGVDAAEVGIEIAEAFEIFEGVSSITGPIGAAIGAVVFVGTDVYLAVKRVDKIDEIIHLTTKERFIEGLRAFIGMNLEGYIEELIGEKQVNNQLVEQGLEYLKQHDNIQKYVFPTGKSVIDSCRTVQYREQCPPIGLNICYEDELGNLFTIKKREKCTTKLQIDLNNKVLLDRKRTDIKWSRGRPNDSGSGEFLCLPQGNDESVPSNGTYLCENAIGIEYANNRTENNTLISLGNGDDVVVGFPQDNHVVVLGDGHKNITLGDGNDTFLLEGNNITGVIYGGNGTNTLDLEHFAKEEKSIQISLSKTFGYVYHKKGDNVSYLLGIHGINDVLLRRNKQDHIHTTCDTRYVDGRGGEGHNNTDNIIIPYNSNCSYEIKLIVRPYTNIKNYAINGNFTYIVPITNKGEASVNLIAHTNPQSNHRFVFSHTLYDVNNIEKINNTVNFSFIQNVGHLRLVPKSIHTRYTTDYEFNISNNAANNASYRLSDNTEIKVGERNIYAIQSTNKSVDEIISDYPTIANNLKMSIFVQSLLSNETVAVGHGNHDVLHNDPYYKSHLVGNGGENIFVVTSGYEVLDNNKLPIPEVVIYDADKENLIDTLDLRQIKEQVRKDLNKEVKAKTLISNKDLLIELLCFSGNQVPKSIVMVRLNDALVTNWHERLHVILDNIPMKIEEFELKPLPLIFDKNDKNIIVIGPQDIEEENKVIVSKEIGNYIFARSGNNLIITNAFDRNLTSNEFCTISLSKFYQEAKMRTLSIKFADKEIILKDHQEQISAARDIDVVKKEHKDQVYNDVFNHTRSENIGSEVNETTIHEISEYQNVTTHQRSRRAINEENIASSATRVVSRINDLFGWVKSSISGLFNSRAALPENNTTQSSISQIDAQVNVDGTIMLLDVFIRKITGREYISTEGQSMSLLEAQGYALNITTKFEQVLKYSAIKSGISVTNLNFNPVAVQSTIVEKIISGKFSKILETLHLSAKEACPEFKQTGKFLAQLKSHLAEVLAEKETVLLQQKIDQPSRFKTSDGSIHIQELSEKPKTFLNGTAISKLSYIERAKT